MRARLFLAVAASALAACGKGNVKPDLPDPGTAVRPEVVVVEKIVYVPVPARLTRLEPIAEGPLSECPVVARERRAALERCNARLAETATIQGTEVEP